MQQDVKVFYGFQFPGKDIITAAEGWTPESIRKFLTENYKGPFEIFRRTVVTTYGEWEVDRLA